jgi:hypothetical protein
MSTATPTPSELNRAWGTETLDAVRGLWGLLRPWEIAREINVRLVRRGMTYPKADGTPRRAYPSTTPSGTGVIWQAWNLRLIDSVEQREELLAIARKESKSYLNRLCYHDFAFKDCSTCYLSLELTNVLLHNPAEGKSLFMDVEDFALFEAEFDRDPQGYEILAVREPLDSAMVSACLR